MGVCSNIGIKRYQTLTGTFETGLKCYVNYKFRININMFDIPYAETTPKNVSHTDCPSGYMLTQPELCGKYIKLVCL